MVNPNSVIDIVIQKKFKKALEAKKERKLFDFRKELKDELESMEKELRNISKNQWNSAKKLINEITLDRNNLH